MFYAISSGFLRRYTNIAACAAALVVFALANNVFAAPPQLSADSPHPDVGAANPSLDGVYNWADVPLLRQIEAQRVLFDRDGYVIYDKAGETINVPFVKNDIAYMEFAPTTGNQMLFESTGTNPVLYVPSSAYLLGAPYDQRVSGMGPYDLDVSGARWFPLPKGFKPLEPVFMGPAPNWDGFINSVWYPGMVIQGGFYRTVAAGTSLMSTPEVTFQVDGHVYKDWGGFMSYSIAHPTPSGEHGFGHGGRK